MKAGLAVVAVVVAVLIAGLLASRPTSPVSTDRLGPDSGEALGEYIARASESLTGSDDKPRWALLSLAPEQALGTAADIAQLVRVATVLHHVPIPDVQTPVVTVDVPAGRDAVFLSAAGAASQLAWDQPPSDTRPGRIAWVSAMRLRSGCACVTALVVRGTLAQLRTLATYPGMRAVQALPPDTVRFAVRPLIDPTADDGPVPAA